MPPPKKLTAPKLLLVEGRDEESLYDALVKHLHLRAGLIQIETFEGNAKVPAAVRELRKISGWEKVEALGIIRDAEASAGDAFKSVYNALKRAGLPRPGTHGRWAEGPPRVGIFIQPDGKRPGMLEDLCLKAVQDDQVMPCVDKFFECVAKAGVKMQEQEMKKARAHCFLASRDDPTVRVGVGGLKHYWNFDHPVWNPVKEFLRAM